MTRAIRNIQSIKNFIDNKPLTIIIPAAGEGTRMKAYGPKSLIKITTNINLLNYQIKLLKHQFPLSTIILISGYEAHKVIINSPPNIIHIENERYSTTNVARSIELGLRATITNRVIIIYGDLVCNAAALNYPLENKSLLFIDTSKTMTENEVGCIINEKENYIEHVLYDLPNKWAQIMYLVNKELNLFRQIVSNPNNEKLLGFEVINEVIDRGGKFIPAYPKNIKANDIDCSKDLLIVKQII